MDKFEHLLYTDSTHLPSELTDLKPPCPWKEPVGQICWGLALITITFNFFGLDIILPAVGTALLWLGLHFLMIAVLPLLFSRLPAEIQTTGTVDSDSSLRSELL